MTRIILALTLALTACDPPPEITPTQESIALGGDSGCAAQARTCRAACWFFTGGATFDDVYACFRGCDRAQQVCSGGFGGFKPEVEPATPPAEVAIAFTPFDPPAPVGQSPGPIDSSDTKAICSAWFGICVNGSQGCRTQPVSFYYCLSACWVEYNNCVNRGGPK